MTQTRMANTVPAMGSLSDWGRVVWDRRDWVPNIAGTPMPRVSARPTTMRVMGWWRMACRVRGMGFSLNVGDFLIICRGEWGWKNLRDKIETVIEEHIDEGRAARAGAAAY